MSKSRQDKPGGHRNHELETGGGVVVWTRSGKRFGKRYKARLFRRAGRDSIRLGMEDWYNEARDEAERFWDHDVFDWDQHQQEWDEFERDQQSDWEVTGGYDQYMEPDDYYEPEDYWDPIDIENGSHYSFSRCPMCGHSHRDD